MYSKIENSEKVNKSLFSDVYNRKKKSKIKKKYSPISITFKNS